MNNDLGIIEYSTEVLLGDFNKSGNYTLTDMITNYKVIVIEIVAKNLYVNRIILDTRFYNIFKNKSFYLESKSSISMSGYIVISTFYLLENNKINITTLQTLQENPVLAVRGYK